MRLRQLIIALILVSSHPTSALALQPGTPGPVRCPLEDGVFNVAWLPKALNNQVFELGRIGAETRAAELSEVGPCRIEVLYTAPITALAEEQARLIEEITQIQGIDAIGLSCIDPEICIEPINAAVAKGIPVMTWDSDSPDSDRFTYLGIDNYAAGEAAADLLIRVMGERGQVAILSGVPGSDNLEQRIMGFRDVVATHAEIEIVSTVYSDDLASRGVEAVEGVMATYPEIDGWFFAGLWPIFAGRGAMPRWEKATLDGGLITISFDTLPLEIALMEDGFFHGLIGQKYWGWGYDTVGMLYDHVMYGQEFEDFTDSGFDIVTTLNMAAMKEAWETNNFSEPLPDPFQESTHTGEPN